MHKSERFEYGDEEVDSLSSEEIFQKINSTKGDYANCTEAECLTILNAARRLSAVLLNRASTFDDYNRIHFASLHPEDRKFAYLKTIELAPTKDIALELFHHAFDEETKLAAKRKLENFTYPSLTRSQVEPSSGAPLGALELFSQ